MTTTCRFCLEDSASPDNPFLSPCDCKGSVQHVHLECLRRWRTATNVDTHRTQCQMCNVLYRLPRKWPRETWVGPDGSYIWNILSQKGIVILLVYYLHMSFLLYFVPPTSVIPKSRPTTSTALTPLQMDYAYQHERDHMLSRITSPYGTYSFLAILGLLTIVYGVYYATLFARVVNKGQYWRYFGARGAHLTVHPLRWAMVTVGTLIMSRYYIAPFGGLYVYFLVYYMQIHRSIVRQIDVDGDVL